MDQQQRQILAFERESVIPSSKYLDEQDLNQIQNKVPFENASLITNQEYEEAVEAFIKNYSSKPLSKFDYNIINELADKTYQSIQEDTRINSNLLGSLATEHNNTAEG